MSRIFHGDCLEELARIPSNHVDLVLTDPPYGMKYRSWRKHLGPMRNDNNFEWVPTVIRECYRILKPNTHLYMFCNDYSHGIFRDHLRRAGFHLKRTLVWLKNNHGVGDCLGDYGNKTEFIIFAHKGRRILNGKRDTNILRFSKVLRDDHPTPKPVDLCRYLIEKSTSPGELVLDPFMGAGAIVVAAKSLGRAYIGIEIDDEYFRVAEARTRGAVEAIAA